MVALKMKFSIFVLVSIFVSASAGAHRHQQQQQQNDLLQHPLNGGGNGAAEAELPMWPTESEATTTASGLKDMPLQGFGTWNLRTEGHNASRAVEYAIRVGYRHVDCAAAYGNERDVGRGIRRGLKAAGLPRGDLWVTSKLWNDRHAAADVPGALDRTLRDLGLDYVDLYLMHWPVKEDGDGVKSIEFVKTWRAMEKLLKTGKARRIGVCNFSPDQLRELLAHSNIRPYAHQMEIHPYLPQTAWIQYHHEQGIRLTAYSPLGNSNPTYDSSSSSATAPADVFAGAGADVAADVDADAAPPKLMKHPILLDIAERRGCTPATIALTWGVMRGTAVIPKSQHRERIRENMGRCALEYEDWVALRELAHKNLTRFNNPSESWNVTLFDGLEGV